MTLHSEGRRSPRRLEMCSLKPTNSGGLRGVVTLVAIRRHVIVRGAKRRKAEVQARKENVDIETIIGISDTPVMFILLRSPADISKKAIQELHANDHALDLNIERTRKEGAKMKKSLVRTQSNTKRNLIIKTRKTEILEKNYEILMYCEHHQENPKSRRHSKNLSKTQRWVK